MTVDLQFEKRKAEWQMHAAMNLLLHARPPPIEVLHPLRSIRWRSAWRRSLGELRQDVVRDDDPLEDAL